MKTEVPIIPICPICHMQMWLIDVSHVKCITPKCQLLNKVWHMPTMSVELVPVTTGEQVINDTKPTHVNEP